MDFLENGLQFFTSAAIIVNILGTLLGLVIGAIPGLGPVVALVLAIPVTYSLEPSHALVFLLAVYTGSVSGGGISSVLLNVPGTVGSISTAFDGFPMAKMGRAREALAICITSSAIGAMVGGLVFVLVGPSIGIVSGYLGPAEYSLLIIMAFILVAAASQGDGIKAIIMALMGLLLSFVGRDISVGTLRFTWGILELQEGVSFSVAVIGLFAMGEVIASAGSKSVTGDVSGLSGNIRKGVALSFTSVGPTSRSSLLGAALGLIPGIGISLSGLLSWAFQRKVDSKGEPPYGKGNYRGVVASEVANNASATGSLPLAFGLGVPGGAADAILLGGLLLYGLRPGKSFFQGANSVFSTLTWGVLTVPIILLASLFITKYLARLTIVPYKVLLPLLTVLSVIGAYSTRGQIADVWLMFAFGIFGYFLVKAKFPLHNLVIGMVLGPLLEQNVNRALVVSKGSLLNVFDGWLPIVLGLICLAGIVAILTPQKALHKLQRVRRSRNTDTVDSSAPK